MAAMNRIELHYYIEAGAHSMDAFAKNRAEAELLKVFQEVSILLDLDLSFELEALKEGGIREFFKILSKKKTKKKVQKLLAVIGLILTGVITTVVADYLTTDHELEDLQKQELRLRIEQLRGELDEAGTPAEEQRIIQEVIIHLVSVDKIKLHKSKFYSAVQTDQEVYQLSTTSFNATNQPESEEKIILRSQFQKFISDTVVIDPEERENVLVEIVSPVLKDGKMKWKGQFEGRSISFNLLDSAFKRSVLAGEVSFSSGTAILCSVQLEKAMGEDGEIKVTQVNIYDVIEVQQGTTRTSTNKGKRLVAEKNQGKLDLFGSEADNVSAE